MGFRVRPAFHARRVLRPVASRFRDISLLVRSAFRSRHENSGAPA
jgi:hypothetical protein